MGLETDFLLLRNGRVCAGLSLALYLTWYYVGSPGECFLLSTVCVQAWLERAENAAKAKKEVDGYNGNEKKRKRTSIAAPEKRSLEAYFTVQPRWALSLIILNPINQITLFRPSSEKIAAIAEKLDLKKNVVRVWFCNQRQKQKRMKFSAYNQGQSQTAYYESVKSMSSPIIEMDTEWDIDRPSDIQLQKVQFD